MAGLVFRRVASICIALSLLVVIGCGAGYRTTVKNGHETVYYVDEDGNKKLVYEIAKDGTVTIHDENDPKAQQLIAQQERIEQAKVLEEERIARIEQAPKRQPDDPIFVAMYDVELDEKLKQAQHSEGAVNQQIRGEFDKDPIIRLIGMDSMKDNDWAKLGKALGGRSVNEGPASDVNVVSRGYLKEVYGVDKKTGKPASMVAVVFEATITCNYLPATFTVSEEGNVLLNKQVSSRFADKIKYVIKNQIGPTIPADRDL
jgi:hypothetical protein